MLSVRILSSTFELSYYLLEGYIKYTYFFGLSMEHSRIPFSAILRPFKALYVVHIFSFRGHTLVQVGNIEVPSLGL